MATPHRILLAATLATSLSALTPVMADPPEESHAQIAGEPDLTIKDATKDLKATFVAADLTHPHVPNTSMLWCATFQLAWDQFTADSVPLRLDTDPAAAVQLSAHPFPTGALDDASFLATINSGPEGVRAIMAELERKFNGAASPTVLPAPNTLRPGDIIAYAYLFKNLAFETPFTSMPQGMTFGDLPAAGRPAMYRAFGLSHDTADHHKVAQQVTVWHYAAPDNFVIELHSKEAGDHLIIARVPPHAHGATLRDTVDAAMIRTKGEKQPGPRDNDIISIPVLNFDITRSYTELTGHTVLAPTRYAGLAISEALQNIRFRLDEKGAILKSDAVIIMPRGIPAKEEDPRHFICDGPFLVVMQREAAETPYFAAWIDNPELLVIQK